MDWPVYVVLLVAVLTAMSLLAYLSVRKMTSCRHCGLPMDRWIAPCVVGPYHSNGQGDSHDW